MVSKRADPLRDSSSPDATSTSALMRPAIQRSWRRSSLCGLDRDQGRLVQANLEMNLDTELQLAAAPVLDKFDEMLSVAALVVLSDAEGRFVRVWSPESAVLRRFEQVGAHPGASAGEDQVGTNAIGTALEEGRPMVVVGSEHYQQNFEQIACAAAPVHHPLTKRTIGSIALATIDGRASNEMLSLVVEASRAVERRVLERASAADRLVLEALKMRGGGAHRSVVGLSRTMMMANEPGMRLLSRVDQALLWEGARETVEAGRERSIEVVVGTDNEPVRVQCVPVRDADLVVGALIDFGCGDVGNGRRRFEITSPSDGSAPSSRKEVCEPFVGRSREARYLLERIACAAATNSAVLVAGEPGAGKAAVARRILAQRFPRSEPVTVSCSDPDVERLAVSAVPDVPVVVEHVELLDNALAYRLRDALRRSPELGHSWVATINVASCAPGSERLAAGPLVDELGGISVEVPSLRYRRDDIAPLVEHFSKRAGKNSRRFTPEVMQLMLCYPWHGNIRELKSVAEGLLTSTSRDIELQDLPANPTRTGRSGCHYRCHARVRKQ
jgi:transcriptional regulator of acetoin/glycerol metabolism